MVRDQTPALCRLVIDIAGNDIGVTRALFGHDLNALQHAVQAGAHGLHLAHLLCMGANAAVGKHGFKGRAYRTRAQQARTAGVHTNDVVLIGPAGHEFVDVAALQGFIKSGFDIVGIAAAGRGDFGFSHGQVGISALQAVQVVGQP